MSYALVNLLLMAPGEPPWAFGRRPRFVAAPSWLGSELADQAAGVRHLVQRYLAGFGPAGIDDIHKFSHVSMPVLRAVVEAPGAGLVTFRDEQGRLLYDVPGGPLPPGDTPAPVRFLPMWDSLLLAYADRGRVMPDAYRPSVIRKNGDFLPTFTVDGMVAGLWRAVLVRSDFRAGCAVLAVTVSADVPDLVERAAAIFRSWRERLGRALEASGIEAAEARALALTIIAACEGAVVMCRAERSLEPLDVVAAHLRAVAVAAWPGNRLPGGGGAAAGGSAAGRGAAHGGLADDQLGLEDDLLVLVGLVGGGLLQQPRA